MSRLGPVYTLAAGAVVAVALGAASLKAAPSFQQVGAAQDTTAAAAPPAESLPAPSQEPSQQPSGEPVGAPDPTPKKADYAGVVQGNGGLVAIAVRDGKAVAYFCDGRIEAWLKGTAENGTVTLEGKDSLITAALGGGKAQGRLQVGKAKWRFTAPLVKKPSGLYRASAAVRGAKIVGGWIVLPNGQEVGRVQIGGSGEPAPRYVPGTAVDYYGVTLRPEEPDGFIDELVR
ncbi:hypothetical protein GCM10023194_71650 [Planotetraspora phitsanulokensis]|uniref:Serine/threonine protein kinase n=1 Tax=Planotetraspora phitsanulokensis TaxID=575192 RepID=A0A8J3U541_9ACTN|nr:hypothetical protein [Planotetraspora phitsanulokensis]GII37336.1 hypothetical protein Pph01_23390 [Planotetraspora phitsanulokensis]